MKKLLMVSVALSVLLAGCMTDDDSNDGARAEPPLIGTWIYTNPIFGIELGNTYNADLTFEGYVKSLTMNMNVNLFEGTYTWTANNFTTTQTACQGLNSDSTALVSAPCAEPIVRTFPYTIAGTEMTITDPTYGNLLFNRQ